MAGQAGVGRVVVGAVADGAAATFSGVWLEMAYKWVKAWRPEARVKAWQEWAWQKGMAWQKWAWAKVSMGVDYYAAVS